jgi:hypothetical protein
MSLQSQSTRDLAGLEPFEHSYMQHFCQARSFRLDLSVLPLLVVYEILPELNGTKSLYSQLEYLLC